MKEDESIVIQVNSETAGVRSIRVAPGSNLRDVLLQHNLTPYRGHFQKFNCQGMGVCGSCKVWIVENGQKWDRRSCQIQCFQDIEIGLQ